MSMTTPAAVAPIGAKKKIGDVILDVKNISLRFGGVNALTDISFNVREHEAPTVRARVPCSIASTVSTRRRKALSLSEAKPFRT